ncbi:Ger(x)C family spore germination protein [Sutcliffiella halmapala]|uniref:Ger(x)C family spore germination protein n=1 Tax=Sutcliffiella halmapala TaxID=79882 RepID=UPI000995AAA1|nr:Ger(x)C family spore germination protein [Sutcliffiella halmapala]
MRASYKLIIISVSAALLLLTGCWDQQLLKDRIMIKAVAFDETNEGDLKMTLALTVIDSEKIYEEILYEVGATPRNIRTKIERSVHENLDASKNRVVLISEDLAKKDIYPILDVFYRDPSSALVAKFAITEGEAGEIINESKKGNILTGEFISDLIINAEDNTFVPDVNLQVISPYLFDPVYDFTVPILRMKYNKVYIDGLALFNDKRMGGKLTSEEATLFLLQINKLAKDTFYTIPVLNDGQEVKDNISIAVLDAKSKMTIHDEEELTVNLDLNLQVGVIEFPEDDIFSQEKVDELNTKISIYLTEKANTIIRKLQAANCDGFGIGRKLYAYHPKTWEQLLNRGEESVSWKEIYPTIKIEPSVKVEIQNSGIIN